MKAEELNKVIESLRGANLSRADLGGANFRWADLGGSDLSGAELIGANLSRANLSGANLRWADLIGANLSGANLSGANLIGANLIGANLSGVIFNEHTSFFLPSCPSIGAFTAFKKCNDDIMVTLLIPEDAKRSSATSYKCRASKAVVLSIDGDLKEAVSIYDNKFIYRVGETITVDDFDDNRWVECGRGIHFFMHRELAQIYS